MPKRLSRRTPYLLILCILLAADFLAGAAQKEASPSTPSVGGGNSFSDPLAFAIELKRIGGAVEKVKANPAGLAALRGNLPPQWQVSTGDREYNVSSAPLRELLRDAETEKKKEKSSTDALEASAWATDLADQVTAYVKSTAQKGGDTRGALEKILSRREFASVRVPSSMDLLKQKIARWLARMLLRIFGQIGRYPIGATILFWGLVAAVVVWLAMTLFRFWMRHGKLETLNASQAVVYVRTWQEWIQMARESAAVGDLREAVHSAYWAGISYLEDSGLVRKDRTRTPREYVRLVTASTQFVEASRQKREAISALTGVLEQVWYGRKPASEDDFVSAMQSVEALGCPLR